MIKKEVIYFILELQHIAHVVQDKSFQKELIDSMTRLKRNAHGYLQYSLTFKINKYYISCKFTILQLIFYSKLILQPQLFYSQLDKITSCFATCCNLVPRAHGLHGQQGSGQLLIMEATVFGQEIASVLAQTSAFVNFHSEPLHSIRNQRLSNQLMRLALLVQGT